MIPRFFHLAILFALFRSLFVANVHPFMALLCVAGGLPLIVSV